MRKRTSNKNVILKTNSGILKLTAEQFSRWVCLFEACDVITEHANKYNLASENLLKPAAIEEYIEKRYPSVLVDVEYEMVNGMLI